MTGTGRIRCGGSDCGAGTAIGARLVVTANHAVRRCSANEVEFQLPDGSLRLVEDIEREETLDAAILHLADELHEWLPVGRPVQDAGWRVDSPPPGNDPRLTGSVTQVRVPIENAQRHVVSAVQLEVRQELGDYRGYSGSGVLDSTGRAIVAVLVEQTHLRIRPLAGAASQATNVLFAIPVDDVVERLRVPVQAARPTRFEVRRFPAGTVDRGELLDRLVAELVSSALAPTSTLLVRVWGYGGMGKTVLTQRAAYDVRIWSVFPGGIFLITAGEGAGADEVRERLRTWIAPPGTTLSAALAGDPTLVIVDDVWSADLVYDIAHDVPGNVTIAVTTRGVTLQEAELGRTVRSVHVGQMGSQEALRVLRRDVAQTRDLDAALGELARVLGYWPLLLDIAASELHGDELEADESDDLDEVLPASAAPPEDLPARANAIARAFQADPTNLDDLASQERSFDRMVRRSLERVAVDDKRRAQEQELFLQLAVYPADAELTQQLLADLWSLEEQEVRRRVKALRRVGLINVVRSDPVTIKLHDLIVAWLYHERGNPEDPRHQAAHRRCAKPAFSEDGAPGDLTADRAQWLAFHLRNTGNQDEPARLLGSLWRSAYRLATGSDAVYLAALRQVAQHSAGRLAHLDASSFESAKAQSWTLAAGLMHAYLSAVVGQIPAEALMAEALLGRPEAALQQAANGADQYRAAFLVTEIVTELARQEKLSEGIRELAVDLLDTLRNPGPRVAGLLGVAATVAGGDADRAGQLIDQAIDVSSSMPDEYTGSDDLFYLRSNALADTARLLADIDRQRAVDLATTIPDVEQRSQAMADIARSIAAQDLDAAIQIMSMGVLGQEEAWADIARICAAAHSIDEALDLLARIPVPWVRSQAIAHFMPTLAEADPRRAVNLARSLPHDSLADIWVVERLASSLAVIDADQAIALANSIESKAASSRALAAIAEAMAPADPERAIELARNLPEDSMRGKTLVRIADILIPSHLDLSIDMAATIRSKGLRSQVLASVAEALADTDPERGRLLLGQAVDLAQSIPVTTSSGQALAQIAEIVNARAAHEPDGAIRVASSIADAGVRNQALANIAAAIASTDPLKARSLLDEVTGIGVFLPELQVYWQALASVAMTMLAGDTDQAVQIASTITPARARSVVLSQMAAALWNRDGRKARLLFDRGLEVATGLPDHRERADALAQAAVAIWDRDPEQAQALVDQALDIGKTVSGKAVQVQVLSGVAEILAARDPAQAVDLALALPNQMARYRTAAQVLPALARSDPERAVTLAAAIPAKWTSYRHRAFVSVMAMVPYGIETVAAKDPDRAIGFALTLPNDGTRSRALAGVARILSATDPDRAASLAATYSRGAARGRILAGVARGLAATTPDRAVAIASGIRDTRVRCEIMAEISAAIWHSHPETARSVLDQAVKLAATLPNDWVRCTVLARMAVAMWSSDPGAARAIIDLTVDLAMAIPQTWARDILAGLAQTIVGQADVAVATLQGYLAGGSASPAQLMTALGAVWWSAADTLWFVSGYMAALETGSKTAFPVVVQAVTEVISRFSSPSHPSRIAGLSHPASSPVILG
jgi:NB-ARC domain